MNREKKQFIFIYILLIILVILLIALTFSVLNNAPKKTNISPGSVKSLNVNPYPNTNPKCIFNVSLEDYNNLAKAGCQGGYTQYNIDNVTLDNTKLKITVVSSDKNQKKAGIIINDKKVLSKVYNVAAVKFYITGSKLFILDTNNNKTELLAVNRDGKVIYSLQKVLTEEKIKDKAFTKNGNKKSISSSDLNPSSISLAEGQFTFQTTSNACAEGKEVSGSTYKVTYKNDVFSTPKFEDYVKCS